MNKKSKIIILIIFCSFQIHMKAQNKDLLPGVTEEIINSIQTQINLIIDDKYRITSVLNVDSSLGSGLGPRWPDVGPIEDSYGTLTHCFVFICTKKYEASIIDTASGIVGIFKDGKIIWNSNGWLTVESPGIEANTIWAIKDINKDGKTEILTTWISLSSGSNPPQYLWIISWDGHQGLIINASDNDKNSVLSIDSNSQFILADIEGDGIWEIQGKSSYYDDDSLLTQFKTFSWNGNQYGYWASTPQPSEGSYYPQDKIFSIVKANVIPAIDKFEYCYEIKNLSSSFQDIHEFAIDRLIDTVTFDKVRRFWEGTRPWLPVIDWECYGLEGINYIKPGEAGESQFSFLTIDTTLPTILKFYTQGWNGGLDDDITINSYQGLTIGPNKLISSIIPVSFLDTLTSFTTRSRDLGWIKQQPISDKYTGYFSTAKTALQKNQISLTRTTLTQVLHDVDVDSSSTLTSEAYALIKYNTEYLLAHLPNTISALDMLDTLRVRTDCTIPNNTLCGRDFKEDLIENIAKAKKELIEKDTIACALYIKMYEKQLYEKYNHRKGKPCVTDDEYNYLYPYAESIVELILPLPPKCGGSCKDKLFDLKSEIGSCTKKGYCSRGEFENGMEEQIDKAVKCIENKDSTGTATCLGLFEQEVQQTYEQTKKRYDERKYVKPEGYITLYYKAEYILEELEH